MACATYYEVKVPARNYTEIAVPRDATPLNVGETTADAEFNQSVGVVGSHQVT